MDTATPDQFLCPSRPPWAAKAPDLPAFDIWKAMPDGTKTCSYCGSMRETDYLDILRGYDRGDKGFRFDASAKDYKRYASRPGVRNANDGAIKFYLAHAAKPFSAEFLDLEDRAIKRLQAELQGDVEIKPERTRPSLMAVPDDIDGPTDFS